MNTHALAPDEIDDLLAAFALDALEPAEQAQVAAYVAEHADAQREVDAYRRAAARFESAGPEGPRPEVWDRIAAQIEVERPTSDVTSLNEHRQRRRARFPKVIAVAAAIVALSGTALALGTSGDDQAVAPPTANEAPSVSEAADRAAANPNATSVVVPASDGAGITDLVVLPSGVGYILTTTLPVDVSGVVYGLYAVTADGLVKLAVLDGRGPIAFRTPPGTTALVIATQDRGTGSTVTTGALPASPAPSAGTTPTTAAPLVPSGTPVLPITPYITLPIL
jgi:hypothetical protein